MRFDPYSSGTTRPTTSDETAGVRRAAAIYAAGQPTAAPNQNPGVQAAGDARANVSPLGQLLRDLHGIKSHDPKAFSNVTASIADRLYEMAARESSDEGSEHIQRLAERFSVVSQTGNLAALRPMEGAPPRGLHGPAAYATQRQREESRELRVEVRSAIDDVLQPFVGGAAEAPLETEELLAPRSSYRSDETAEGDASSPRALSVTG